MQFILPEDLDEVKKTGLFFVKEDKVIPKDLNKVALKRWLKKIIQSEAKQLGIIYFHYCSDDYLSLLNKKHLNHSTLTDIISFQYSKTPLDGDIYISIDRVEENALIFGTNFLLELMRLHAHGILHFCGFNDGNKIEKEIMRRKEDEYLSLCPIV